MTTDRNINQPASDQAQRRPFFSLRHKMLVYFGLLFTVSLVAMELVSLFGAPYTDYEGEFYYQQNEIFRSLDHVADSKKEYLVSLIEERKNNIMALAKSGMLRDDGSKLHALFGEFTASGMQGGALWSAMRKEESFKTIVRQISILKKQYKMYEEIEIADIATGIVIASTDDDDLGENVFKKYAFMASRENGNLSKISFDKMKNSFNLSLTEPVLDIKTDDAGENQIMLVLIARVNSGAVIYPLLHTGRGLNKTGEVVLVDSDTRIIAPLKYKLPNGLTAPLGYKIKAKPAMMGANGEEGITVGADYRGEPVLAAYRHILISPDIEWGMVVKIDKSEAFAPLYQRLEVVTYVGSIGLMVTLLLAWFLAYRMSVPLTALSRAAGKMERGDMNARVEATGSIETYMLASAFNSMIAKVDFRRMELEELVLNRTIQLQSINVDLVSEIAERKNAEEALKRKTELVNLLQEITGAANNSSTADEAIQVCLDKVCDYTGWELGHAYMLGFEDTLIPTQLWRIDDPHRFKAFYEITKSIAPTQGVGLPGRVLQSGKPVWFHDLTHVDEFLRAKEAVESGLKTGFGFPVLEKKKTVAVLTFFTTKRAEPDESLLKAIENITTQLGRVTERKRAKEEIEHQKTMFESIFNGVADAIVFTDTKRRIVMLNPGFTRILGYSLQDIVGKETGVFYESWEVYKRLGEERFNLSAEEKLKPYVVNYRRKNGSLFPGETTGTIIKNRNGEIIGFIGVIRDITERKRAEEELKRHRERLEEIVEERTNELSTVNKELEAFAYSVSHDLRAPLRGIDGFSKALLEDYADKVDDVGKDYLNRVSAATLKMSQLIDDLLTLSRVTRTQMMTEPVGLSELAHDVADDLRKEEPDRHIKISIEKGLIAQGDKRLLRIVLYNLISNSWKFTWKRLDASIEIGAARHDGKIVYFVRDNGVGFDMKYSGKLFGAFQRLHTLSEFPGTGIGLAIVQRIIHRHGGRVWAEAEVDKGAVFYLAL
ncbi:diguanylate cyclase/phosphodiesterase (GGDEF & EAL domains) with PAS/PAC sensor(s) [hydrothermal vent metagenome]|uniref:histidine kinase n=1 Tax=hydrothermal vent metagenome TaxID=652676 RepID=A0A3B1BW39_9ZZZZ